MSIERFSRCTPYVTEWLEVHRGGLYQVFQDVRGDCHSIRSRFFVQTLALKFIFIADFYSCYAGYIYCVQHGLCCRGTYRSG